MYRSSGSASLSLCALILCGCGASRPIRYYSLQSPTAPSIPTGSQSISLVVANIGGPEIFKASPIVYRVGANEIGTYQYSRWVEPPVEMVQSSLIRALRSTGNYASVASFGSNSDGQFLLRGRLNDFEEIDAATISGLVSMEFELYDRKSGKVLWSHSYSESEAVQGKEISSIVAALNANLDRGLKETAAALSQYFSSQTPGKS